MSRAYKRYVTKKKQSKCNDKDIDQAIRFERNQFIILQLLH